jgi:DNA-binding GntR family transcriptional regulator
VTEGLRPSDDHNDHNDQGSAALAYGRIRRAIVEGRYAPGTRLVEQTVSEELSLSRTPVREAFRRLEVEGLVLFRRNRGAVVRSAGADEIRDLYELRARLESYAAELAAERGTARDVDAVGAAAREFDRAVEDIPVNRPPSSEAVWAVHEANGVFHGAIVVAARHARLHQLLMRAVDVPLVLQAFHRFEPSEMARSAMFHHMIARAVCSGEGARAGRLMAEHVLLGRDRLLSVGGEADRIEEP